MKEEEKRLLRDMAFRGTANGLANAGCLAGTSGGQTLRYVALVSDVLRWFEKYPHLQTVKVSAIMRCESSIEADATFVRMRHHVRVVALGAVIPELEYPDADQGPHTDFVIERVPYKEMGDGMIEIHRHDPRVQRWLALCQSEYDPAEVWGLACSLSWDCREAFSRVWVDHDLGLATARVAHNQENK